MLLRHTLRKGGGDTGVKALPFEGVAHTPMDGHTAMNMQAAETSLRKFTINKGKDMNGIWRGMY